MLPETTEGPVDWGARFGRVAPLGVEIGFGMGHALLDWAVSAPEMNLVGIDVYRPGIGSLLAGRAAQGIEHLLVAEGDARVVMERLFGSESIHEARIFFPDPWPKKRHHKRRLVNPEFMQLAARKLEPGGHLHIATDWANYAGHIDERIEDAPAFRLAERREHGGEAPLERPTTKFERRGLRKGHRIFDWKLERI